MHTHVHAPAVAHRAVPGAGGVGDGVCLARLVRQLVVDEPGGCTDARSPRQEPAQLSARLNASIMQRAFKQAREPAWGHTPPCVANSAPLPHPPLNGGVVHRHVLGGPQGRTRQCHKSHERCLCGGHDVQRCVAHRRKGTIGLEGVGVGDFSNQRVHGPGRTRVNPLCPVHLHHHGPQETRVWYIPST